MNNDQPLAHDLPYWESFESPYPHMLLSDGSLSMGLELFPVDIECFDEPRVNHLTCHRGS